MVKYQKKQNKLIIDILFKLLINIFFTTLKTNQILKYNTIVLQTLMFLMNTCIYFV